MVRLAAVDDVAFPLEIISPAGFERFFEDLARLLGADPENLQAVAALNARYGVTVDASSVAQLVREHGLVSGLTRPGTNAG